MKSLTTNQKKFFALIGGLLLMTILAYQLSIKKTLNERKHFVELTQKNELIANLEKDFSRWRSLNVAIDKNLGGQGNLDNFQENLLREVGNFCNSNNLTLTEFSKPFKGVEGSYSVETIILKIEGEYKPLLKLTHHLESKFRGGKIASAGFIKERNFRTNREQLFLQLYVQKIKKKDDEMD